VPPSVCGSSYRRQSAASERDAQLPKACPNVWREDLVTPSVPSVSRADPVLARRGTIPEQPRSRDIGDRRANDGERRGREFTARVSARKSGKSPSYAGGVQERFSALT
jgi:hypothetical protein